MAGPMTVNSSCTTDLLVREFPAIRPWTLRRAGRSPCFARVTRRSAYGWRRLALVSVVLMDLCSIWLTDWLASMRRWFAGAPPRLGLIVGGGMVTIFIHI